MITISPLTTVKITKQTTTKIRANLKIPATAKLNRSKKWL